MTDLPELDKFADAFFEGIKKQQEAAVKALESAMFIIKHIVDLDCTCDNEGECIVCKSREWMAQYTVDGGTTHSND